MPCVDVNFDTGTDTFYETPEAIQSYFQCAAGEGIVGLQFGRMFHYEKVGKSKIYNQAYFQIDVFIGGVHHAASGPHLRAGRGTRPVVGLVSHDTWGHHRSCYQDFEDFKCHEMNFK